jgi:maltooligosyltrehalose trehalohydrolase
LLLDPESEQTFRRCKLDHSERQRNGESYALHRDLIQLRHEDAVFANPRPGGVDGAVLATEAFVIRFFGENGGDRLLLINLGIDLDLKSVPEPLVVSPAGHDWKIKWSSENPCYGGAGTAPLEMENGGGWRIPGHAALVLVPVGNESRSI